MSEFDIYTRENTSVIEVTKPARVISPDNAQNEAPEFNFPIPVDVVSVRQRQAKFSEGEIPLLTLGLTQCELEIMKTFPHEQSELPKYGFLHVQSGELRENEEGSKLTDIVKKPLTLQWGLWLPEAKVLMHLE